MERIYVFESCFFFVFSGLLPGEYCEVELDQPCPATWWGYPVCGPCSCDVDKGYDPNCNKTNGQCVCQVRNFAQQSFILYLFVFCCLYFETTCLTRFIVLVFSFLFQLFAFLFCCYFSTTTGESLPTGQRGGMSRL